MRRRLAAALLLALLGLVAPVAQAQHRLTALPLDDPAYDQLESLLRQGCAAARVSPYRPYLVGGVRDALVAATKEPRCAGILLQTLARRFSFDSGAVNVDTLRARLSGGGQATLRATAHHGDEFQPLWRDLRPNGQGDPSFLGLVRARASFSDGAKFLVVAEGYAETDTTNDPTVRARAFRKTSGVVDVSEATINGQLGPVWLSFGRSREAWLGEGTESLVLSANGPAYDRIALDARWRRFEFRAFAADLDDVLLDPAVDSSTERRLWHRFLFAHALTFRVTPAVELTAGETALLPVTGGGVNLAFANPLIPFQIAQHDDGHPGGDGGDANLTGFVAARATVGRFTLHGEWLIDDIQIDASDRKIYPDLFAWYGDVAYALPLKLPLSVGLRYERVGGYTYLKEFYSDVYQQYGQPIGSQLGPDGDLVRAYGDVWASGRLHVGAGLGQWRRGAQRIDDRPSHDRKGHADQPYPTIDATHPDVQRAVVGDATVQWADPRVPLTLRLEGARVDHPGNQPVATETLVRAQLEASFRFRYP